MALNNSSLNNGTFYSPAGYNYIEKVSIVFMMCLFTVLAIPGNAIVIFIVSRVQSMKTSTNFLLLNLCIADLLIAVIYLPFITVALYITNGWIFGTFMCKLVSFSQSVATKASILILTALSLERYLSICRPNRIVITAVRVRILCASLWIVAMGTALPLFIYKTTRPYFGNEYCTESWSFEAAAAYTYVVFALFYVMPLLVMVALYLKIGQKLLQSTRKTSSMRHPNSTGKATLSSKTRLTRICVLIILSFALSWAPAHIITLHYYSSVDSPLGNEDIIYPIVSCISYSNCALNPLLYCFMSQNFRNAIVTEWKRLTTRRRQNIYGGLPGMSLRGRDSILRTLSMRIQGSLQSSKEQEETETEIKSKHESIDLETSLTVFESAL
ncbi:trissin receptor-like [Actinia tenebrosa]|uniref:Trissin receptor-like n=1 Tax=Actinia tenebrosa TaxID=6105 RepID=A0A6P8JCV4_ACTTE|nr:trissin receptor-like [Actinia tenebrosa]